MTLPHHCPEPARLKAFLEGALPEPEQAELNQHFESCEHCQQTLEGLVAGKDSWANLPRHLGQRPQGEDTPTTEEVSRSEHSGKTVSEKEHGEASLGFLEPPDKPGLLGRLGHYGIQEVIGMGGFGIVLKAFDEKLHRVVAIKVLSAAYAASATARKRFTREAQAAAAIAHEHVVTIHAVEDDSNPPYLVMQFIDGFSLQDKLDQHGPLGLREILRIALQTAEGLAAAHKQGLVHRDIKPANILLENGVERVKITDFGLARAIDDASLTQSGVVAGTPMYMSPEQAEGHTLDCRSDLFSLGTVLYVMCTGRPPFRASGTMAVLKRVIDDTPRPIRETNPEIPDWLEAIIVKLHAKKAEDRFQTAKEVAERLGHHLAELQVGGKSLLPRVEKSVSGPEVVSSAAAERLPARAGAWRSRRRWFVAALLVMAATAVAAWMFWPKPVGALRVEVPDQKLRVDIVGPFTVFRDGDQLWSVPPGRYLVEAKRLDERGHYQVIFSKRVEVSEGQTTTVLVSWDAAPSATEGWVQLFNGKDLAGWQTAQPEKWEAQDGAIIGHGGKAYLILKDKKFENFHCRLEAKMNADGWGGLAFRHSGENHANVSICPKLSKTGSLFFFHNDENQLLQQPEKQLASADTWLTLDVIVRGPNVVVLVNGTKTADASIAGLPDRGPIELCADAPGTVIHFRKIEIKELPPLPTEPGWVQLFNGKDLTGWILPAADKDVWSVKDGILIGQGAECSMLSSERGDFRDFHLRVEAMINEGGDSGVWFRTDLKSQDGYEANINHSHRDPARTGSLGAKKNHMQKWLHHQNNSPAPANTWFTLEVIAAGPNLTVRVDGVTIAQVTDANRSSGHIGLEMFEKSSVAKFRKIEFKLLSPFAAIAPFDAAKAKEHQDAWAKHLGLEPEISNSIGMKLRLIPPGEFLMGSSPEEIAWLLKEAPDLKDAEDHVKHTVRSEGPQRGVEVREPFYMGVHEVMVGQFREFVRATKHRTEAEIGHVGVTWNDDLKKWERKPENVWDNAKLCGGDTHPVVFVTLADAQAFCAWLTKQEGRAYAVPAEEHWEWACRAGTTTHWFFGDNAAAMKDFGWTTPRSEAKTKPVGRLAPNPFGLCDIYGNVQELTISAQKHTIFRGGQTGESPQRARSASRIDIGEYDPAIVLGFRVVIVGDLKAKTPPVDR